MTFRAQRSERSRHLVLRASAGEPLPQALSARLAEEGVSAGWLRASGVLVDVELRAFDGQVGTLGTTRRLAGPVQVLSIEGGIGMTDGEPTVSLRALLAREGDSGLETLAGEITSARTVALEIFVTALDDVSIPRTVDAATGLWLLDPLDPRASQAPPGPPGPQAPPLVRSVPPPSAGVTRPSTAPAWSAALEASVHAVQTVPTFLSERELTAPSRPATSPASPSHGSGHPQGLGSTTVPIPQRPTRPNLDLDTPTPEAGDVVDHFAFGRCDVVKSDGDRLHLRIHKDGRIREIALEMLRVTRLEDEGGVRRFKLERRL